MGDPGVIKRSGVPGSSVAARPLGVRIGYFVGITSPRRAAILAVVVCALALSVAVPLRNYVGQRSELAAVHEQQQILADKIEELQRRRDLLSDPQHVQAQARERLRYVRPGEAPYLVQLPPGAIAATGTGHAEAPRQLWYAALWKSINGG
jgi:cell division protein FtsB